MYAIRYKQSVEKDLRKLSRVMREAVVVKILALAQNPRPNGVTKLRSKGHLYRIRHSDYRIVYEIRDNELIIVVIKIAHRRDVYKTL